MSKETPQPQQSEEVDLGQLFKLIGNAFDRFFKFIGSIFYHVFLAFVWLVFFVKKHAIKLIIAGVIGVVLGVLLERTSEPVYKSYITVKQNYNTGENLYNSIAYYSDLVKQRDFNTLESVLDISSSQASSILGFDIESVISENERLKEYNDYVQTLDSSVASTLQFEKFLENDKEYSHKYQQITIKSKERDNFKSVFSHIIDNLETNEYFKREQEKDLAELNNREEALKSALTESDSLKNTYKRVLEKGLNSKNGSEIGITFEGNNDKDMTKEYDLYKNDLELKRELVEIERKKADKAHIVEIISSKQESGVIDNRIEFMGVTISTKVFYGLLLFSITFLVLLGLQFIKFLERYRHKI